MNRAASIPPDYLLWQLADSAFPIGGFSHSAGLESAWQHHVVRNSSQLNDFLRTGIHQLAHAAIPFISASFNSIPFAELDLYCEAFLSNHVANRASRSQGRAFLAVSSKTFPCPQLKELQTYISLENLPGHFAPLFGKVAHFLAFEERTTQRLFLFTQVRAWISSAIRLSILGPLEAQSLQASLYADAETLLHETSTLPYTQACQTAPILELMQGTHDRLYSRLFQS